MISWDFVYTSLLGICTISSPFGSLFDCHVFLRCEAESFDISWYQTFIFITKPVGDGLHAHGLMQTDRFCLVGSATREHFC